MAAASQLIKLNEKGWRLCKTLRRCPPDPSLVQRLLAEGASANWVDDEGITGLHLLAGAETCPEVSLCTEALLDAGADCNARTLDDGLSPLHIAAEWGRYEFIQQVLAGGANVKCRNSEGLTPTDVSIREGHTSCVELLEGCQLNGSGGLTILDMTADAEETVIYDPDMTVTLEIDEYNEANDTLEASQSFDETFDETFDVLTGAEHLAVSGSPNDTFTLNLSICVPASIYELSDDDLRHELLKHGETPGPINNCTRSLYRRHLARLDKGLVKSDNLCKMAGAKTHAEFRVFSPELRQCLLGLKSLPDMSRDDDLLCAEFGSDRQPVARSREHCIKASFVYLLIDPRVSDSLARKASSLDELDVFKQFVLSVFYVGKGKRSRPYQHLHDAMKLSNTTKPVSRKLARIFDIWASRSGVVSLHVFQGMTQSEAYTREACIIDAMGLTHLTNAVRGHYHGTMAGKTLSFKRQFGVHLLRKACKIFLLEGERQILPKDLRP